MSQIKSRYSDVLEFANENRSLCYDELDQAFVKRLTLFAVPPDLDIKDMEARLDHISRFIPSLKRIASAPITRLKDTEEILPIEAVRIINNRSIVHASQNSKVWDRNDEKKLMPKKLLTVSFADDYTLYENAVYVNTINKILDMLYKKSKLVKRLLFSNGSMKFDLLDGFNHVNYYLSIGKLATGYMREFDKYRPEAINYLKKQDEILNSLASCIKSPVYINCKPSKKTLKLTKTDIFNNHKDYKRLYNLANNLDNILNKDTNTSGQENGINPDGYFAFVSALTVFAMGGLGFDFDKDVKIDISAPAFKAKLYGCTLTVDHQYLNGQKTLVMSFENKGKCYNIKIIPRLDVTDVKYKGRRPFTDVQGKIIYVSPFDEDNDYSRIDLYDIDSFLRIQRYILDGMIYCDGSFDICPFCGNGMEQYNGTAKCNHCHTVIKRHNCPVDNSVYYSTEIHGYTPQKNTDSHSGIGSELLYGGNDFYYRNITPYDKIKRPLCPLCNILH